VLKNRYFWLALLWTTAVVVLSLISFSKFPKVSLMPGYTDKITHFVFYFGFVFLWGNVFLPKTQSRKNIFLKVLTTAILVGTLMEILQETLTQNRTFDWLDILANSTGALIGILILSIVRKPIK
jgi:VanZ family protein